jgi:hypothetical protein
MIGKNEQPDHFRPIYVDHVNALVLCGLLKLSLSGTGKRFLSRLCGDLFTGRTNLRYAHTLVKKDTIK